MDQEHLPTKSQKERDHLCSVNTAKDLATQWINATSSMYIQTVIDKVAEEDHSEVQIVLMEIKIPRLNMLQQDK